MNWIKLCYVGLCVWLYLRRKDDCVCLLCGCVCTNWNSDNWNREWCAWSQIVWERPS